MTSSLHDATTEAIDNKVNSTDEKICRSFCKYDNGPEIYGGDHARKKLLNITIYVKAIVSS